jgi:hypothetical protein
MSEHLLALESSTTFRLQQGSMATLNEINSTTPPVWVNTDTDTENVMNTKCVEFVCIVVCLPQTLTPC